MTHAQMERELARATGESISTIRTRGFQLIEPDDAGPQIVDWEAVDEERLGMFPDRQRRSSARSNLAA